MGLVLFSFYPPFLNLFNKFVYKLPGRLCCFNYGTGRFGSHTERGIYRTSNGCNCHSLPIYFSIDY